MKISNNSVQYSASDLVNFLGCNHLNNLDRRAAIGEIALPDWNNPSLKLLQKKGEEHEAAYIAHLKALGLNVCELEGQSVEATLEALKQGYDIITQARLKTGNWVGIADVLVKVDGESDLGKYYYEIEDTKLAKETKAGTVVQLCLYAELLADLQGITPLKMRVVKPGDDFPKEEFQYAEFEAYFRLIKGQYQAVMDQEIQASKPYPVPKCDTCRWWKNCNQQWHDEDHLSLVANIRSNQIKELEMQGIPSLESYANEPKPFREKPEQGNEATYEKVHNQAKIQLAGRKAKKLLSELLPIEPFRGLNRLPQPTTADIYFDIEGDHFYEDGGLEYLFGYVQRNDIAKAKYQGFWARNRREEKEAFSKFMKCVMETWNDNPGMHIYHYAPYEPSAVKRLASRHSIYEEEVDQLLRAQRFIDLYSIVKETLIASVESYSLKDIEQFTDYVRKADLQLASQARRGMSVAIDFNDFSAMTQNDFDIIELYNADDCYATLALHQWVETIFQDQLQNGHSLERPELLSGDANEKVSEDDERARALYEGLVADLSDDPDNWTEEEKAKWLLAHQIQFYRRELKSAIWEFYRLNDLEPSELLTERKGVFGLEFKETVEASKTGIPTDRYTYPAQEISLEIGKELWEPKAKSAVGKINDFSLEDRTVDIKKTRNTSEIHPFAAHTREVVSPGVLVPSLYTFAEEVIQSGVHGDGLYRAGRDLLIKNPPRLKSGDAFGLKDGETIESGSLRLAKDLDQSILPIQGPPGTGKTYIGAGLIAELVKEGKKVGVTAVSHKVIRGLLDRTKARADEKGIDLAIKHKPKSGTPIAKDDPVLIKDKNAAIANLQAGAVVGGTSWLWADDDFEGQLDYLFVDEAGQMSLTNVLTISRATKNLVLLGDPQQLEQPKKGAHPEGADVSALEHLLDGKQTIAKDRGLFLDTTWRLNPNITAFTSKLYYDGRLKSREGLEVQAIDGETRFVGSGLFYVSVDHAGNQSQSKEEVSQIVAIVNDLIKGSTWTDLDGTQQPLTKDGILIVAPYNAQVSALKEALPDLKIGTVDKFQGQEAPVVIYSMTSSSPEDAPRGMSFLYNPNRLNVATSRAKCVCILVANSKLFEASCNTISQMRWANGLCLYREMANTQN